MKRFLTIALAAILTILLCGCNKSADYYRFVSQERRDILVGESETYAVKCYLELREKPFKSDGKKQETSFAVIVKLTIKSGVDGIVSGAKVSFKTDKEYSALFTFHRESDDYVATSYVNALPEKELLLSVTAGDKTETINAVSVSKDFTFDPQKALGFAVSKTEGAYEDYAESGNLEINVRMIYGEKIFYYVGIITEDKTDAFLIDSDCKTLIARKTLTRGR